MSAYRICGRSLAAACCLLVACSVQKQGAETGSGHGGSAGTQSPGEMAGAGGSSTGGRGTGGSSRGGAPGGHAGEPAANAGDAEGGHDDNAGASGADAAEAGAAGTTREVPPDAVCELDGGSCVSNPTSPCESPSVACSVQSDGVGCEFAEFKDASATVACGATAAVGTACCGGCGCVKVEVYYDGKYCWQGIPDCPLPEYSGKLLKPQRP